MDFGELTVLFCDLVDSPALAGQLGPTAALLLLPSPARGEGTEIPDDYAVHRRSAAPSGTDAYMGTSTRYVHSG
jgi:hypothetical protein